MIRPWYMTPPVFDMYRTTERSWLTKRYVRPSFSCRSRRRLRICAGSTRRPRTRPRRARRNPGRIESARAIEMPWHWPPESSRGYAAACRGAQPDEGRAARRPTRSARDAPFRSGWWTRSGSSIVCSTVRRRLSEANGSWRPLHPASEAARQLGRRERRRSIPRRRARAPSSAGRGAAAAGRASTCRSRTRRPGRTSSPRLIVNETSSTARTMCCPVPAAPEAEAATGEAASTTTSVSSRSSTGPAVMRPPSRRASPAKWHSAVRPSGRTWLPGSSVSSTALPPAAYRQRGWNGHPGGSCPAGSGCPGIAAIGRVTDLRRGGRSRRAAPPCRGAPAARRAGPIGLRSTYAAGVHDVDARRRSSPRRRGRA